MPIVPENETALTYTLSPQVYRELGQSADYVRLAGFEPIQQEQMVLQLEPI